MTEKTDWTKYYENPYKLSSFTKNIIIRHVLKYIKRYAPERAYTITEFGGGNSCFYPVVNQQCPPEKYYIVDNNQTGLDAFKLRFGERENTLLMNRDILEFEAGWQSDISFSVGLIEHFSVEGTRNAVLAHMEVLKPGGILILGFPTPTFLYRAARKVSELLGMWIFHDERPLKMKEVLKTVEPLGDVLETGILWSIVLTQAFIVLRKHKR